MAHARDGPRKRGRVRRDERVERRFAGGDDGCQAGVGVPCADVVVAEILDRGERGHTDLDERHVIRTADPFDHVPPHAEVAEWLETLARAEKSHAGRFTEGLESIS